MVEKDALVKAQEAFSRIEAEAPAFLQDDVLVVGDFMDSLLESQGRLSRLAMSVQATIEDAKTDLLTHGWNACADYVSNGDEVQAAVVKSNVPYGKEFPWDQD